MEFRKFTFGKYKGKEVCDIVINHIGYILWLLENTRFKLTELEQECFDAVAIAKVNGNIRYVFPKNDLKKYIKNKDMVTPFAANYGYFGVISKYRNNKIATLYRERYYASNNEPYQDSLNEYKSAMGAVNRIAFEGAEDDEYLNEASSMSAFLY